MDLSPPSHGGTVHPAWANPRAEVTAMVPSAARTILDVGCSTGDVGAALLAESAGRTVVGIEIDDDLAVAATARLTEVITTDVEELVRSEWAHEHQFDCVVLADVLEHLRDPWAVTRWAASLLTPAGSLVISVPNVRHLQTLWNLIVRRRWPYQDVGIFDRTHLRFFGPNNLDDLVPEGMRIAAIERTHVVQLHSDTFLNRHAHRLGDFGTLQFIFRVSR